MEKLFEFTPIIKNSFYQTVLASAIDLEPELASKIQHITMSDNDLMTFHSTTPKNWVEEKGIVVMLHGFCGSHRTAYMKRVARQLYKKGHQVIRVNWRGCGSGKGLARKYYHDSGSPDVMEIIKLLKVRFPNAPIALVGFSLGGNAALKLAGDLKKDGGNWLQGVVAVCPPMDLEASARRFALPENSFYTKYFRRFVMKDVEYLHRRFKDLPPHNLTEDVSFRGVFEHYVAPRAGFRDSLEYFDYCGAKNVLKDIVVPVNVLISDDDPLVDAGFLDRTTLPKNVEVHKTRYGGHLAFLGRSQFRWMDHFVVESIHGILS